jgi:hypothetical protein
LPHPARYDKEPFEGVAGFLNEYASQPLATASIPMLPPIKRTAYLTSSKKDAASIADKLVEENVKKGWESAG